MMHPPCDAVRLRLAERQLQELHAEVAQLRRSAQIPRPGLFTRFVSLATRLLSRTIRLAGALRGVRIGLSGQVSERAPDEPAVLV